MFPNLTEHPSSVYVVLAEIRLSGTGPSEPHGSGQGQPRSRRVGIRTPALLRTICGSARHEDCQACFAKRRSSDRNGTVGRTVAAAKWRIQLRYVHVGGGVEAFVSLSPYRSRPIRSARLSGRSAPGSALVDPYL